MVPAAGGAPPPQIGENCVPGAGAGQGPLPQPQTGSSSQLGEGKAGLAVGTGHLEPFGERSEKAFCALKIPEVWQRQMLPSAGLPPVN